LLQSFINGPKKKEKTYGYVLSKKRKDGSRGRKESTHKKKKNPTGMVSSLKNGEPLG